ncbi:MAG: aminopeptidase, partial [Anaerovibrio lipolyticus]|nr:aminopeptidase [Anaerovibrio lipolyticus]
MAKDKKKDEKKTPIWNKYTEAEKKALHKLNEGYKNFLSQCKTERESVVEAVRQAEKAGYKNL